MKKKNTPLRGAAGRKRYPAGSEGRFAPGGVMFPYFPAGRGISPPAAAPAGTVFFTTFTVT